MIYLATALLIFILSAGFAVLKHEGNLDWIEKIDLSNLRF